MLVSEIGEFGLIKRLKESIRTDSSVIKGIGDDCAVIKFTKDKFLLFTCDMLVEGVDFYLKDKPELIGRKALAVSISDIASCGGIPRYALLSLGIPKNTSLSLIDRLSKGLFRLARTYKINIVGGDLSSSSRLTLNVTLLGIVEKKNLVLRSGAKKGDIIFVSGSLGGSIRGKHLTFSPRLKEARFLVKNLKVHSMLDISDGLMQDLNHILEESKVGAVIHSDLIPLSRQARTLNEALYMGEDFELLFTLSNSEARRLLHKGGIRFKPIGEIVEEAYGLRLVGKNGQEKSIKPKGYTHF